MRRFPPTLKPLEPETGPAKPAWSYETIPVLHALEMERIQPTDAERALVERCVEAIRRYRAHADGDAPGRFPVKRTAYALIRAEVPDPARRTDLLRLARRMAQIAGVDMQSHDPPERQEVA